MSGRRRWLWLGVIPVGCLAYQWVVHSVIVHADTPGLRAALVALNAGAHAAINLFMLWVFGRTLVRGREALITGFARRVHGSLPDYLESYTRNATTAWCVFFAAQVVVSALLLAAGWLEAWSLFVNVLSFPSVAVMFVAEYLYRITRFRDYPHTPIWKSVQAFAAHRRVSRAGDAGAPR